MSHLKEQYERETGKSWQLHHPTLILPAEGYVKWLEAKVEKFAAPNSAMVQCSCGSRDVFVNQLKPDVYWCRSCRNMWTTAQHQ